MGILLFGLSLFLLSCGSSPEDICSNEKVINDIGFKFFIQEYFWLGANYVKKDFGLSSEDLSKIENLEKEYKQGKISDEQVRKQITEILKDKISLKKIVDSTQDNKHKNHYFCSAVIQIGDKKYLVDYKVIYAGDNNYVVEVKNTKEVH